MEEKKPYKQYEPEKHCAHEPAAGYMPQSKPVLTEETDDEFEKLWKEGMTVEEFRVEAKRIIREIADKKYGKR